MQSLNATLKLQRFLELNGGTFPPIATIGEYFEAERKEFNWSLKDLEDNDDIAKGWRYEFLFRRRLNLSHDDEILLDPRPPAPPVRGNTYNLAWRNYFRTVLKRGHWFSFATWPTVTFHVAENKILAGREQRGEGDAEGRTIVVTFFEDTGASSPAMRVVQPVERSGTSLRPRLLTLAELLQTCGEQVPHEVSRSSAAEVELYLEERLAQHDLRRFNGALETDADDRWTYTLSDEGNAEDEFMTETLIGHHTKMSLARCLERIAGDDRKLSWNLALGTLKTRVGPLLAIPLDPPVPPVPGAGRGRRGATTSTTAPPPPTTTTPPPTPPPPPPRGGRGRRGRGDGRGRA